MMAEITDVVEFSMGRELYAMDIQIAREIVEMVTITPVPRAPAYIAGIINLRGELTNILNLRELLGLPAGEASVEAQKIIVLMADMVGGSNLGIIVDDVRSVVQISEKDVERMSDGLSTDINDFVKGIIKMKETGSDKKGLVIWLDMIRVIENLMK